MDPIADMISVIKNGFLAKKDKVKVPFSAIKFEVCKALKEKGLIRDTKQSNQNLVIKLKYNDDGSPKLTEIKRISKPSRRVYVSCDEIPRILQGLGFVIISTSKGVIDGAKAKKMRVGGELICKAW